MRKVLLPTQGDYQKQSELDECWSVVYSKANPLWLWAAICRRTRPIVSFVIGDRTLATGQQPWLRPPEEYRRSYIYSNHWQPYSVFIDPDCHEHYVKQEEPTNHIERFSY
jgi:IS1 family transposase